MVNSRSIAERYISIEAGETVLSNSEEAWRRTGFGFEHIDVRSGKTLSQRHQQGSTCLSRDAGLLSVVGLGL